MGHTAQRQEWKGEEREPWWGRREGVRQMYSEEYICLGSLITLEHIGTTRYIRKIKLVLFLPHQLLVQMSLLKSYLTLTCVPSAHIEDSLNVSFAPCLSDRVKVKESFQSIMISVMDDSFHHPFIPHTPNKLPLILTGSIKTLQGVRALI